MNYILLFLNDRIKELSEKEIHKLFNLDSNRLIDELIFTQGFDFDKIHVFSNYTNQNSNPGTKHKFSGYNIGLSNEPAELAMSIKKWVNRGKSIESIAEYIDFDAIDKVAILDIGMQFQLTPEASYRMFKTLCHDSVFEDKIGTKIIVKVIKDDTRTIIFNDFDGTIERIRSLYVHRSILKGQMLKRMQI